MTYYYAQAWLVKDAISDAVKLGLIEYAPVKTIMVKRGGCGVFAEIAALSHTHPNVTIGELR